MKAAWFNWKLLTNLAWFILIGNYWQTYNEIMTNQCQNKNRNHINTRVSFNFIHYMADLLRWGGAKWVNFALFFI